MVTYFYNDPSVDATLIERDVERCGSLVMRSILLALDDGAGQNRCSTILSNCDA